MRLRSALVLTAALVVLLVYIPSAIAGVCCKPGISRCIVSGTTEDCSPPQGTDWYIPSVGADPVYFGCECRDAEGCIYIDGYSVAAYGCGHMLSCQVVFSYDTPCCVDNDNDGWGVETPGYTQLCTGGTGDCDDTNPNAYPGAPEVCDGADNNCDGKTDYITTPGDLDNSCGTDAACRDYYCNEGTGCTYSDMPSTTQCGTDTACTYTSCSGTCGKTGAYTDYHCNGAGTCSPYSTPCSDTCSAGTKCSAGSCVLSSEICGNGEDDDCDGLIDSADSECPSLNPCQYIDGKVFNDRSFIGIPGATVTVTTTENTYTYPSTIADGSYLIDDVEGTIIQREVSAAGYAPYVESGISEACDGQVITHNFFLTACDYDGDGFDIPECGGDDCDDENNAVNTGAIEVCGNGADEDCDGLIDCADPDCAGDAACPTCSDGIQNQDETGIDCGGTVCPPCSLPSPPLETCSDGIKNQDETGVDCGGATCPPCQCVITDAAWITPDMQKTLFVYDIVSNNTPVDLYITGENCEEKFVSIKIWEDDTPLIIDWFTDTFDDKVYMEGLSEDITCDAHGFDCYASKQFTCEGTNCYASFNDWPAVYPTLREDNPLYFTEVGQPEYYFVADTGDDTAKSGILIVTGNLPPVAPAEFLVEPNGGEYYDESANITWNPVSDPDDDPLEYRLEYGVSTDAGTVEWNPDTITEHYGYNDTVEYNGEDKNILTFNFG